MQGRLEYLAAGALVGAAGVPKCRGPEVVDEPLEVAILGVRHEPLVVDAYFDPKSRFPAYDGLVRIRVEITIEEMIDVRRNSARFVHIHRLRKGVRRRLPIDPGIHTYQTV